MIFTPLGLEGACLIGLEPIEDERGYFARSFCRSEFSRHGLHTEFPQHSVSFNRLRGTLRGLHIRALPFLETKVVRCVRGRIYDVIVDLRQDSPTRGKWLGMELGAATGTGLYVPAGFAHGFITLEHETEVFYQISPQHEPGQDLCVRWNDAGLAIEWPLQPVLMSARDGSALSLQEYFNHQPITEPPV